LLCGQSSARGEDCFDQRVNEVWRRWREEEERVNRRDQPEEPYQPFLGLDIHAFDELIKRCPPRGAEPHRESKADYLKKAAAHYDARARDVDAAGIQLAKKPTALRLHATWYLQARVLGLSLSDVWVTACHQKTKPRRPTPTAHRTTERKFDPSHSYHAVHHAVHAFADLAGLPL